MSGSGHVFRLHLRKLEERIKSLLVRYEDQQQVIVQLRRENDVLKEQLEAARVSDVGGVPAAGAGVALWGGDGIDGYIKEIEEMITCLEKL